MKEYIKKNNISRALANQSKCVNQPSIHTILQNYRGSHNVSQMEKQTFYSSSKISKKGGTWIPENDGTERDQAFQDKVLFPCKHFIENDDSFLTKNRIEIMGGHLLPKRWGGKGAFPNVQPWSKSFESGAWEIMEKGVEECLNAYRGYGFNEEDLFYYVELEDNKLAAEKIDTMLASVLDNNVIEERSRNIIVSQKNMCDFFKHIPQELKVCVKIYPSITENTDNYVDKIFRSENVKTQNGHYNQPDIANYENIISSEEYVERYLEKKDGKLKFKTYPEHIK